MKKYIAMLCSLIMLMAFTSCGDTPQKSSEQSSSISEIENLKYETDYFSFEYPSNWEIEKGDSNLRIISDDFTISFSYFYWDGYKKLKTDELKEKWKKNAELMKEEDADLYKEQYENCEITDDFVKNGQAYIVITDNVNHYKKIEFYADKLHGTISLYSDGAEEAIMSILETIEFY